MSENIVDDDGRRNELREMVTHAIKYFETRVELGVIVEVRAPDLATAAQGDTTQDSTVVALIREKGMALAPLDTQLRLPLLESSADAAT